MRVVLVAAAQAQEPSVGIAKIVIDSVQIEQYKLILRECIEIAVKVEREH